ncbi:MAG: MFS transporter, partial [Leptotrichiaceae bacterium]|nr:MFS transporter [Leptotrichiaceae bacterium]MBP7101583.1 MFS transporter [Leptotrichiaceae bacterium]
MILLMFFCIFLYNLGHPATPDLIELRHLNKSISGVFLAIMSSSMFLSSPYLGALADSIGMKKIFIFMPIMYGLAQVFFGFSNSLLVMMLARIMAGFASGGTYAVVLGYVSQISKKEEKSKNIAKISSIAIVGGAIGQKVGGLIGLVDTRYPFGMQLIFGILVSLLIFIFMNEIVKKDKNEEDKEKKNLNPLSTFKYIYELDRNSKFFCFIIFLSGIGIYSYA